jgi:hypothetical protein
MADISFRVSQENVPSPAKLFREVLADAFTFVRSAEANQALAAVTLDDLIEEHIGRNGESADSNAHKYNPYSYDPAASPPAGTKPPPRVAVSGTTATAPTRLDRITAIHNELQVVIADIRARPPVEVADAAEYTDGLEDGLVNE